MNEKYCAQCGKAIDKDAMFCCFCGFDMRDRRLQGYQESPSTPINLQPRSIYTQVPSNYAKETESVIPDKTNKITYADFWPRLVAWILDLIVIAILSAILVNAITNNLYLNGIISFIVAWMYFFLLENYNNGQTLGKMALHLKTVDEVSFLEAKPDHYLIDSLTKSNIVLLIIDFILGLFTSPGENNKRLRFTQRLANTVVIKSE